MSAEPCLDETTFLDVLSGLLPDDRRGSIERHLDTCSGCRARWAAWLRNTRSGEGPGDLPAASDDEQEPQQAPLARGRSLGRYLILDLCGVGAMGEVYVAYDAELQRRVSLKLLRHDAQEERATAEARLIREARALARVSHPNVVSVYDVGTYEGQVYIALELVDGETAGSWAASPRPWREVLATYQQAGRGLAAAHRAGMLHRDVKPDNILVGTDGRARITDFGLAGEAQSDATSRERVGSLERLTRTGAVLGTPAYMAPELLEGRPADARSDQFSFCASLYEALAGRRPFTGRDVDSLLVAVRAGELAPPIQGRAVPPRLRAVLARGLSAEPAERFESMDAFLDALPLERHRALPLALAAITLAGAGLWWALAAPGRCDGVDARLGDVWNERTRAAVTRALGRSGVPYARTLTASVIERLDGWASAWRRERVKVCARALTEGHARAQGACLEEQLSQLRATVELVSRGAPGKAVERALTMAEELPSAGECTRSGVQPLTARDPEEPARAQRTGALLERLSRARALNGAYQWSASRALLGSVLDEARAAGELGVVTEALELSARARIGDGDYVGAQAAFVEAAASAQTRGDDRGVARAMVGLGGVLGIRLDRHDEGLRWLTLARATLERIGGDPGLAARLVRDQGLIARAQGRHAEAIALLERARDTRAALYGDQSTQVASALNELGNALRLAERYWEAIAAYRESLSLWQRLAGESHPDAAVAMGNLAQMLRVTGQFTDALELQGRALAIWERALGPRHLRVGDTHASIGNVYATAGDFVRAREHLTTALAIRAAALGPGHALVAATEQSLAEVLLELGEASPALAGQRRALAIRESALGPAHYEVGVSCAELAAVLVHVGRAAEARRYATRAVELTEPLGKRHSAHARALHVRGIVHRALREHDAAREDLTAAIAALDGEGPASRRAALAEALTELGLLQVEARTDEAVVTLERALAAHRQGLSPPGRLLRADAALSRARRLSLSP